jgi:hypothetical protein
MTNTSAARWSTLLSIVFFAAYGCGGKHNGGHTADGNGDGTSGSDAGTTIDAGSNGSGCGLVTCASQHAQCGPIGDGCGGELQCGSCPMGETCGGGGLFQCGDGMGSGSGSNNCTPRTCAEAGSATCGIISDGCGSAIDCGGCGSNEVCGASEANQCGLPPCQGPLCGNINSCTGSAQQTIITGTVTAPGHDNTTTFGTPDPIYDALVYIPNGSGSDYGVEPFGSGVSCETCSSEVSGDPLMSFTTGVDGVFTLTGAPCGSNIPLVMQLGKWRRMITIPNVACCATTTLTGAETHLPRDHVGSAGDIYSDIPKMAFDTGQVDTLHCVLRNIGVADTEFTDPGGSGRINFFQDNGAFIDSNTPAASSLYDSPSTLDQYDMTLFECVGGEVTKTSTEQQNVINYANAGGRVFATHFSYVWLTDETGNPGSAAGNTGPQPFSQTAAWEVNNGDFDSATGFVDETLQGDPNTQARRIAFANWLQLVGASTTLGQIPVVVVRHDFNSVSSTPATQLGAPAQQWLYSAGSGEPYQGPLHYTFDTPVAYPPNTPPTTECGRVLYSDFHVSNTNNADKQFPTECTSGKMNAQEKTLEFMLFDLASCVGPPLNTCSPKTCAQQGFDCGEAGDGCNDGMVLNCGTCQTGTCGGGGPGVCGGNVCTPLTCAEVNAQCGIIGDGCGSAVDCGSCPMGEVCGGGGMANQCGSLIQ